MDKKVYSKDNPHKDIGKQKFRVRRAYTAWVEYDVIADSKDEAIDAVIENGGIEKIEWEEGWHKGEPIEVVGSDYNSDVNEGNLDLTGDKRDSKKNKPFKMDTSFLKND